MFAYIIRRLCFAAILVIVVGSAGMLLARLAPGDFTTELFGIGAHPESIARAREHYGLDRPVLEQYGDWLRRAVRFDLGASFLYGRPVGELIWERMGNSALLAAVALMFATLVGLPLGVVSGSRRVGLVANAIRSTSLLLLSLPPLLTSLLLVLLAARTGWLPIGGMSSINAEYLSWSAWFGDIAWHLPLPALSLGLPMAAMFERLQSQALAETVQEPFILAAQGRGVSRRRVVWRHAFRVAVQPVVGIYGLAVGVLLSGSFAVEIVSSWPGLGRLTYDALRARDVYLVAGCAAAGAVFLACGSVISDVALAFLNPRLRQHHA